MQKGAMVLWRYTFSFSFDFIEPWKGRASGCSAMVILGAMCARNEDALNEVVCCITIVIAINTHTHTRRGEQEKDCGVIARSRITTRDIFLPWQHHTPPVCIGYGRYTHPSGTIRSTDCAGPRGLQLLSISSAMRCDLDRYTCDVECTPVCPEGLKART